MPPETPNHYFRSITSKGYPISSRPSRLDIVFHAGKLQLTRMKYHTLIIALVLGCGFALAEPAHADCYVEYKAKKDSPLRLHYGIMRLKNGSCPSKSAGASAAKERLARGGWTFLNVVGMSESKPSAKKRSNAGANYLKY